MNNQQNNSIKYSISKSNWFWGLVDHSGSFVIDISNNRVYFEIKVTRKNTANILIKYLQKNIAEGRMEKFSKYYSYIVDDVKKIKECIFPLLYNDQSQSKNKQYKSNSKYKLITSKYYQAYRFENYLDHGNISDEISDSWSPFFIDGLNCLYTTQEEKEPLWSEFHKYVKDLCIKNNNYSMKKLKLLFKKNFFTNNYQINEENNWLILFINQCWVLGFFENALHLDLRDKRGGLKKLRQLLLVENLV